MKGSQVAIDIRDNERNGRAKLHMVEDDSEPEAVFAVSKAKGEKPNTNAV